MKIEKVSAIIDKLVETIVEQKNLEAEIELTPENFHVYVRPWKPYEMKCPYGYSQKESNENEFCGVSEES